MNNETVIAVLATVVVLGLAILVWSQIRSAMRLRDERQAKRAELDSEHFRLVREMRDSFDLLTKAIGLRNDEGQKLTQALIAGSATNTKTLTEFIAASFKEVSAALDPETSKKFSVAIERLTEVVTKHAADIERFGDSGLLMASSCRKMNDNLTALRTIVYGGKRAEDFSFTSEDPESVRRADQESEVMTLMQDHNMSRPEAEKRVRNMYATRPIG